MDKKPIRILGIGGSLRNPSYSLSALRIALGGAAQYARVDLIPATELMFPFYDQSVSVENLPHGVSRLLSLVRKADGLILSSPVYHGAMSGLIKNALDYFEYLGSDEPSYLTHKPVGVITVGGGVVSVVRAFDALVASVQALRGMTLPVICPVFLSEQIFDSSGNCIDAATEARLLSLAEEVVRFVQRPSTPALL